MFYIFYGDDELARTERVAEFKARIGDPSVRDLNTTLLDGRKLTMSELRYACDVIPFLSDKRLVIVEGLLSWLVGQRGKKDTEGGASATHKAFLSELLAYLPALPASTRLIFVEPGSLSPTHPVVRLALSIDRRTVHEFKLPSAGELGRWIMERATRHGGQIEPQAAALLAGLSGGDLRALDQEVQKLLALVNWARPVSVQDVQQMATDAHQGDVFAMVDAIAQGQAQAAMRELYRLLEAGEPTLRLFAMIIRQFRLMIILKELTDEGLSSAEAAARLHIHPFVAQKTSAQARAFSMEQLEAIYRRLQEIDVEIKTGQTNDAVALDMLVAGLAG